MNALFDLYERFQSNPLALQRLYDQKDLHLNSYNSFIEAFARNGFIQKAWDICVECLKQDRAEQKTVMSLLGFAHSRDREKFTLINAYLKKRWPHFAADVDGNERLVFSAAKQLV